MGKCNAVRIRKIRAFGIKLKSRYGLVGELTEMLRFAELAAHAKVNHYVKSIFYDSKSCVCSFTLHRTVRSGDLVASALLDCADRSIAQYELFDYVGHGNNAGNLVEKS